MKPRNIRCLVACSNSNGEPELVHTTVASTEDQIDNGSHYNIAKEQVLDLGYSHTCWVADEDNSETQHLFPAEPDTNLTVVERILAALNKADNVRQFDAEGDYTADFVTGTPEEGEENPLILAVGDHTHVYLEDLSRATLIEDETGNGFRLDNDTYRIESVKPVKI